VLAAPIAALAALVCAGCVKEQSFPEAMKIVCHADRGELAGLRDRVSNREARELIAAAASEPRHRYPARVDRAARRAGLERCGMLEWFGPVLPFDPPRAVVGLDDGGVVVGPLLAIGTDGIQLEGLPIVPVVAGKVPDQAVEDGGLGLKIPQLIAALESWRAPAPGRGSPRMQSITVGPDGAEKEMTLLVAPTTPYRVVFQAIVSATEAGRARFHILVASPDGSLGSMLLRLPQHVSAAALKQPGETKPVGLIISITEGTLRLWSLSGLAGTLDAPRLNLTVGAGGAAPAFDAARLNADLAALAEARWPGGSPPADERQIILQANPETPFQTIVDLMVAVRARTDGRELFSRPLFGRWAFD
jgi:hypothetical protein